MPIRLRQDQINHLLQFPETGMGYQIVEIGGDRYIALNAELLLKVIELNGGELRLSEEEIEVIKRYSSYEDLLNEVNNYLPPQLQIKRVIIDNHPIDVVGNSYAIPERGVYTISEFEGFKRFSAYKDDRRILSQQGLKGLRPGTYATTVNDIRVVPSGLSAVGRYALPNPLPAIYVYTIVPPQGTHIQQGTVRPAFGQAGGGVEIFFPDGIPPGSVLGPYKIPER